MKEHIFYVFRVVQEVKQVLMIILPLMLGIGDMQNAQI